ncbi:MAG TPA: TonB family protein [Thermoanaerobaculia bacterium]|nr:TonB family protein [Thermoanaerobaculia bacterium]HUM29931.1 TonB family protein [Thermoanaerobaculia bacterium]HXK68202.1 TonB family protein [Thermoanaerobaculia bacterium]
MTAKVVPPWAVALSCLLHAGLFTALFILPNAVNGSSTKRMHAVQIRLAPSIRIPGKPKAEPGKPAEEKAPVQAAEPIPKPQETPKASPVAKPKPVQQDSGARIPPPHPVPEKPAVITAPSGGGGGLSVAGTSVSSFDGVAFPFDYYVQQFLYRISANWYRPDIPGQRSVTVRFVISRSGRIHDIEVEEGSGIPAFDRASLRAVYASNPLPPLPYDFSEDSLSVHLKFE